MEKEIFIDKGDTLKVKVIDNDECERFIDYVNNERKKIIVNYGTLTHLIKRLIVKNTQIYFSFSYNLISSLGTSGFIYDDLNINNFIFNLDKREEVLSWLRDNGIKYEIDNLICYCHPSNKTIKTGPYESSYKLMFY